MQDKVSKNIVMIIVNQPSTGASRQSQAGPDGQYSWILAIIVVVPNDDDGEMK